MLARIWRYSTKGKIRPALLSADAETASKPSSSRPNRPSPNPEAQRLAFEAPRRAPQLFVKGRVRATGGRGSRGTGCVRRTVAAFAPEPAWAAGWRAIRPKVDTGASSGLPESDKDIMLVDRQASRQAAFWPERLTQETSAWDGGRREDSGRPIVSPLVRMTPSDRRTRACSVASAEGRHRTAYHIRQGAAARRRRSDRLL
jgi:hypothetical protein